MEGLAGLLPFVAMFAVMWFLLIRPAQKRQKATKQMQSDLKRGDKVITIGGIHGTIDAVDDSSVFLKVSEGTTLQFDRQAVGTCNQNQSKHCEVIMKRRLLMGHFPFSDSRLSFLNELYISSKS